MQTHARGPFLVRWALLASDLIAILAAFFFAWSLIDSASPGTIPSSSLFAHSVPALVLWPLAFAALGLYDRSIHLSVVSQWPRMATAISAATLANLALWVGIGMSSVEVAVCQYQIPVLAAVMGIVAIPALRLPVRFLQSAARKRGMSEKRSLIVGAGDVATLLAEKMSRSPELGLVPVAFLDPDPPESERRDELGLPVYRGVEELDHVIETERINHVVVAFTSEGFRDVFRFVEHCTRHDVEICIVPRFFEIVAARPKTDEIEGVPIISLKRPGLTPMRRLYKRVVDVIAASALLMVLSPVLILTAILIRLESGSPILFRQERVGKDGKHFEMYKFRSMVIDAEERKSSLRTENELGGPHFKMRNDPRITRVGRVIRRLSIDEMPQFLNVLKGDMSLVGPRPPLPQEVAQYSEWHMKRLQVTPGITGLWQILGRVELSFDEMVSLDLNYIWSWSPWLDLSILARTAGAVLGGKGAC